MRYTVLMAFWKRKQKPEEPEEHLRPCTSVRFHKDRIGSLELAVRTQAGARKIRYLLGDWNRSLTVSGSSEQEVQAISLNEGGNIIDGNDVGAPGVRFYLEGTRQKLDMITIIGDEGVLRIDPEETDGIEVQYEDETNAD